MFGKGEVILGERFRKSKILRISCKRLLRRLLMLPVNFLRRDALGVAQLADRLRQSDIWFARVSF